MRRYDWNKHTLEPSPVLKVAEDERSEKSQFSLAVKIKRQSSQSAQLSVSFLTNLFCVYHQ